MVSLLEESLLEDPSLPLEFVVTSVEANRCHFELFLLSEEFNRQLLLQVQLLLCNIRITA